MPMLIDYIDKIARREQRGVLFICFFPPERIEQSDETFDWEHSENRKDVIRWLDEKQIKWTPCFGVWFHGFILCPYVGEIYVDVPYDRDNADYRMLEAYLENPDGTMRNPDITFYYISLSVAMKNAHHDEPGYHDDL